MARTKELILLVLILFTLPAMNCPHEDMGTPTGSIIDELEDPNELGPEQAVTGYLYGVVMINGEGASGITVTLISEFLSSPKTMSTSEAGSYMFRGLLAGPHTVTISRIPQDVRFKITSQIVDIVVGPIDIDESETRNRARPFQGFRGATVDVLIFGDNAYPTARFLEVGVEPGCPAAHWHTHEPVPLLAMREGPGNQFECAVSKFRKADPAPRQCGHGPVEEVRRQDIFLPGDCLELYIKKFGPLAP